MEPCIPYRLFSLIPTSRLTHWQLDHGVVVTANVKTEKLATGLPDPFLAQLKTSKDQLAKDGYSAYSQA